MERRAAGTRAGSRVVQCPGCLVAVDVTRPSGVEVTIQRGTSIEGRAILIYVGRVQVHRCVQCADGEWR